MAMAADDTMT